MTDSYGLWINGADRAGAGSPIDVIDPATAKVIATVGNAEPADVRAAVDAAVAAQPAWAATSPRERSDVLRRAFDLMIEHRDELAALITAENGKPLRESEGEITYAAEFFRWFSEEAVRIDGRVTTAPSGSNRIMVLHQPVGVALLITPWNFPAAMATRKIGPALAAGCSVVVKPASQTPLTSYRIAELLAEAGAPAGTVNVLTTTDPGMLVDTALAHERVRKLSFTGSTEVGRGLLEKAAATVTRVSMELGGNAPFYVADDADLDDAVEGALVAKMRHNAETCTAANRFYVHEAVADDFVARLSARMLELKVGAGTDDATDMGPLIDEKAVQKVGSLLHDALAAGAHEVGRSAIPDGPGFWHPVVVLDHVAPDAGILDEEIFGPVVPIVRVTDDADAIRRANATDRGLVSYVYTSDLARGLRLAEEFESGMVGINRGIVSDPAAPFGGAKQSGIGREGSHEGLLEYTETKYIAVDW